MAGAVVLDAAQQAAIGTLDPDFGGLLDIKEVPPDVQVALAAARVRTVCRFAVLADDRCGIRDFCRRTLNIDPDAAGGDVNIAAVVDAWEAARVRVETRNKVEAEATVSSMPKVVSRTEHAALRSKYEDTYQKMEDRVTPAPSTLENLFDQIEQGEWRFMHLTEFVSREDADVAPVGAVIDHSTGTIKVKKGAVQNSRPSGPEELRVRLDLVANAILMCAFRYPNKAAFQRITPNIFSRYANHLLGEHVFGLHRRGAGAHATACTAAANAWGPQVAPAGQEEPGRTFNVLYLFSGEERKSSTGSQLREMASKAGYKVLLEEWDMLRNPDHDLTDEGKRQGILEQIKGGKCAVIIVTPPCGTWSRVTWANHFGPKPVQDEARPWGYPSLSEKLQKRADEGNIMIVLFIDILMLLGTTWCDLIARRPYFLGKWVSPASIWKLPDLRNAAEKLGGMQSIALHQCNWGAPTPKPTRLLTDLPLHASFLYNQWPQLDGQGRYLGPLPRHCGHNHKYGLAKQHPEEAFRTPAASTYPADMDAALAAAINQVLLEAPHLTKPPAEGVEGLGEKGALEKATIKNSSKGKFVWDAMKETDGDIKEGKISGEKDFEVEGFWGVGRPMQACYKGKKRGVHDGGGLCSPGRWRVGARNFPEGTHFCEIREIIRKFFKGWLSQERGQETFWQMAAGRLTGSPFGKFVDGCRREVDVKLASLGCEVTRQVTDWITDPAHQFLIPLVETGVDLGVDEVDGPFKEVWCENYGSAVDNMEDIRRQVEEDIELAVASLGAVPKELGSSKVRIIHDATHEVMINHRIRARDRMRFPGVDDLEAMVRQMKADQAANPAVRLLMKYDVSRAHKLVPVKEQDWPLMAFSLEKPEEVFMRTVGGLRFRVGWWQRVAAAVTRLAHYMSAGAYELYHLLFADDGLLGAHGADCWRRILYWFFVMDVVEVPITWKKVAGGVRLGWIGYEADIQRYLKAIGDSKVAWVLGWIKEVKDEGSILGSRMRSALGRLSFMAGALVQVRPFLGVIFAWTSRLQPGGFHQVPMAVQIVLEFIKVEITRRPMTEPRPLPKKVGELFRVDAKAEGDPVVVGEFHRGGTVVLAETDTEDSPVGLRSQWRDSVGELVVQGFTDSLVNTHVIDHYMSTAFPLSVVLMELAVQLGDLGTTLQLGWTPREQNEEADALTNLDFTLFNPDLRVRLELDELGFKVIPKIMEAAMQLDSEIRLENDKKKKGQERYDKNSAKKPKKAEMRWKTAPRTCDLGLMASQLRYYLTFIDEELPQPPNARSLKLTVKAMSAEYGLEQVAQLRERAEKLKAKRETQDIYIAPAPPTIGSRGHPQLCRRPCTHFARRSCPHGSKCSFCHLPHDHVSLDKRMRGLLASCSESLLLWTLRPYFASHADPAALVFQELLDRELVLRHPQPPVLPSNKSWQHLGREKRAHSCLSTRS
ncbi:unnamed protein product [Effrenium voratum]|uniref:C3H1-type domain-containing protein n=1 Tax=Effrenium voratum TaxID=2562239 RepID=A0AA36ISM4_9DINO|nr:unnamed protein product [Effrenium voratum]